MSTQALTIQSQVTALQADIKTSLEAFFASLPDMESNIAMSTALVEQSKALTVGRLDADDKNYITATEQVSALRSVKEEIEELMKPFIERLFAAHRTATGIRKNYLDPIDREVSRLKLEREAWAAEQERQRREAAAKAQQEAYEREQARLVEEARQAAATGDTEAAEAIMDEAVNVEVAPVVLPSTVPSMAGTSFRTQWSFEVLDWTKLKPEFIKVDEVAIGKIVRSMHKAAEVLVGEKGAIVVRDRQGIVG